LQVEVSAAGRVLRTHIAGIAAEDPAAACAEQHVRRWSYPASEPALIHYPFRLGTSSFDMMPPRVESLGSVDPEANPGGAVWPLFERDPFADAVYTEEARLLGIQGDTVVRVEVDEQGAVLDVIELNAALCAL
jgi:hypothetical protein